MTWQERIWFHKARKHSDEIFGLKFCVRLLKFPGCRKIFERYHEIFGSNYRDSPKKHLGVTKFLKSCYNSVCWKLLHSPIFLVSSSTVTKFSVENFMTAQKNSWCYEVFQELSRIFLSTVTQFLADNFLTTQKKLVSRNFRGSVAKFSGENFVTIKKLFLSQIFFMKFSDLCHEIFRWKFRDNTKKMVSQIFKVMSRNFRPNISWETKKFLMLRGLGSLKPAKR